MSEPTLLSMYGATLVPALQRIQREFGYLKREAMEEYSEQSGVPRYRLHAVASFFPHFQLTPPKTATLKVCRDMACGLAGAKRIIEELQGAVGEQIAVEGVSCLGRCDRAPAAVVALTGEEHELLYLGRNAAQLKNIVQACAGGEPPKADHDADQPLSPAPIILDAYSGQPPTYEAVRSALQVRESSLDAAGSALAKSGWSQEQIGRFRIAATRQMRVDFAMEDAVKGAVRAWQTDTGWAKGEALGGWSETILAELKDADLRGLGGAGIPAIQKWRDVRDAVRTARHREADDRAFIVVNGDESEPGTFKDREILLRQPHTVVEGVILAGLLTEATQGFIYIRHEYGEQIAACEAEIKRAEAMGVCGPNASVLGRPFPVSVFVSPGGYICGEQSALIEAMSDRRGEPRNMPPKLETNGLLDLPTLVSNVETFAWTPYIVLKGGKNYAAQGVNGWQGRRFFSVSGDVQRPGVYEVPMGMTLRDLLFGEAYCQGMAAGKTFKALAPSGPSGGFLPAKLTAAAGLPRKHTESKAWQEFAARRGLDPQAQELDLLELELELNLFRALSPTQALGAGLVVYGEDRDMAEQMLNSLEFFRNESCGKCVPCRLGSQKFVSLATHLLDGKISAARWDNDLTPLIQETGKAIELSSICGLGRSVPVPLRTTMSFFEDDLGKHFASFPGATHPQP